MITLTINNKDYDIVDSYEEITLGQYIDIIRINQQLSDESFKKDLEIVSILLNDKEKINEFKDILYNEISFEDYNNLLTWFTWVSEHEVIDKIKSIKPKEYIVIDGEKYNVISKFNNMSLGEISSFETLLQDQKDKHELEQAFIFLLRPMEGDKPVKVSMDVIDKVRSLKYKVKLIDIFSTISFFLSGGTSSTTENSPRFSIQKKKV
jgi:hypothetical protein